MERDRRGLRLSAGGALLTLFAFVAAVAAASSPNWASFTGSMSGYFGPWRVCQSGQYGIDHCVGQSSRLQRTWASLVAGLGSAACALFLGVAMVMCPLLVMMHVTFVKAVIKFRHATLLKMVCTAASVLCGVISVLFFMLEVFIFRVGQQSGLYVILSWAFILQVMAVVIGVVAGVGAGIEFGWSRKLGGDPTVYNRDPEGKAATTISNPNFKDTGNGHAHHSRTGSRGRGSQRGARVHRNSNGVAMTQLSGQPYMITANGSNGHVRANGVVAFDPNKTPLRSSLRKPKPAPPEDAPDSSMGIQNLAFTQSSPVPKKKVRIHTQSTSV
ncbi:uncharacterized protein LOC121876760 isoform X2 [Homarus americanus]|uniref:uncharacterized protein LOC121876760 isoform X2 n=1 Tax=Homarus americanus TaxID=6706 RepID=UPI001C48ED6C|nr:uncharacterized protein LOC121876760 isoform X2 [Homarus americanus]